MTVDQRILDRREAWARKASLRKVYGDFHKRLLHSCPDGRLLEVGAGSSRLKELRPDVISIDILRSPWIDVVADAHSLPFGESVFSRIVMIDVLHHLEKPDVFLDEAARVLELGGTLLMIEPAITPFSWFFYKFAHDEPVDLSADPFNWKKLQDNADPFHSNQAIPTLLFCRKAGRRRLAERCPEFSVLNREWLGLFAYPMTGGFSGINLLPGRAVGPVLEFESLIAPFLGWLLAFRIFLTLKKVKKL